MYSRLVSIYILWTFAGLGSVIEAQVFLPGESYIDSSTHIEYIAGNLPIIISSPHGGYREPDSIALRDCAGCSVIRDAFTQELSRELAENIHLKTGCYPHVVINLLHRNRLDANREIIEAADGDATSEQAWRGFHRFIDHAKDSIAVLHERGIFYDVHGHGHSIQRIEVGYALTKNDLQMTDESLNTDELITKSSIRQLALDNIQGLSHAALIRGEQSIGSLLENSEIPAVPSQEQSFPLDQEAYFSGGYNTVRHGSRNGGHIDGIQLECHQDVRFDVEARESFADSLSSILLAYSRRHYDPRLENGFCLSSATETNARLSDIKIYPNPTTGLLHIIVEEDLDKIILRDAVGRDVINCGHKSAIDMSILQPGIYYISFIRNGKSYTDKLIRY